MGVTTWKSVSDMWNYQEILCERKPSLVIEFGSNQGGSALFFASVMRQIGGRSRCCPWTSPQAARSGRTQGPGHPVRRVVVDGSGNRRADRATQERVPRPIFAILDSDHTKDHVLGEMKLLRPLLSSGDYLLVEDSIVNGHPVLPGWGPGPYEAIEAYEAEFPDDYAHDVERENKFGFTFAPMDSSSASNRRARRGQP